MSDNTTLTTHILGHISLTQKTYPLLIYSFSGLVYISWKTNYRKHVIGVKQPACNDLNKYVKSKRFDVVIPQPLRLGLCEEWYMANKIIFLDTFILTYQSTVYSWGNKL